MENLKPEDKWEWVSDVQSVPSERYVEWLEAGLRDAHTRIENLETAVLELAGQVVLLAKRLNEKG